MADVQAKREAAIAKKDEERKAKNAEIMAKKKEAAAKREDDKKGAAEAEETEKQKKEELEAKRNANINGKADARASKNDDRAKAKAAREAKSKYSKKDVFELKKVFDQYDKDGSGKVTLDEFGQAIKSHQQKNAPRPGEKSTLEQRQAQKGLSILDLSESVFHEMDTDGDGDVTFAELLKLMFKFARPDELETMMSWVAPEPEPEPEPKPELSKEAVQQIKSIFKLYDKDKSGRLTVKELKTALEKTGLDVDEIKQYIKDYDADGNNEIDIGEFTKLMESTGAFDEM